MLHGSDTGRAIGGTTMATTSCQKRAQRVLRTQAGNSILRDAPVLLVIAFIAALLLFGGVVRTIAARPYPTCVAAFSC